MERYYYLIKSPAVKKILQSNLRKRKEGLRKALEFAKEHGFEIGTSGDCCDQDIVICILSVPENLKKYFKWNGSFYVPKGNFKCAKEWKEKIDAIRIHLEYPFRTIREETKNDVGVAIENNRLYFPRCVFLMGKVLFNTAGKRRKRR